MKLSGTASCREVMTMNEDPFAWLMSLKWGDFVSKSGASGMILPLQEKVENLQNSRDRTLKLVKRLAAIKHPEYARELSGDLHCFFCGAWIGYDPHAPDCLWTEAKRVLWLEQSPGEL